MTPDASFCVKRMCVLRSSAFAVRWRAGHVALHSKKKTKTDESDVMMCADSAQVQNK